MYSTIPWWISNRGRRSEKRKRRWRVDVKQDPASRLKPSSRDSHSVSSNTLHVTLSRSVGVRILFTYDVRKSFGFTEATLWDIPRACYSSETFDYTVLYEIQRKVHTVCFTGIRFVHWVKKLETGTYWLFCTFLCWSKFYQLADEDKNVLDWEGSNLVWNANYNFACRA